MYKGLNQPCPRCQHDFTPTRKNQKYCSDECRIDYNNQRAKRRYAAYSQGEPQLQALQQQLNKLQTYIASLTIVIKQIEPVGAETIRYQGRLYLRPLANGRLMSY